MTDTQPTGSGPDDVARPAPEEGADADEAVARLRAADPARAVEPDLTSLRPAVDARIAADAAATDDLVARRAGRRRLWPAVAAAAAALLVVGAAGYGLGHQSAPPADQVISLAQGGAAATQSETRTGDGGAVAAPEPGAGDARLAIYPYPQTWRTVFSASGLSDAATTAQAYGFDPAAVFSADAATAAAAVFGLEGEATNPYGAWTVGAQDGTGPNLSIQPDGYASLSYYDPTRDPYRCATTGGGVEAPSGTDCAEGDAGPAPSGQAAAAQMRNLLAALGVDAVVEIESTEYDVPEAGQPRMTTVNAFQVLDGARTGLTWSATFLGGGVQSFYGPLAPVVALGGYAVVSENDAVARLNDPRFGASWGGIMPLAASARDAVAEVAPDIATSSDVAPSDTPTLPPTPGAGDPIAWPVTEVTITGARLGLALQWLSDGATLLLPAYELTDGNEGTWSMMAVADEALDFTAD
jgi:hypothetical protein